MCDISTLNALREQAQSAPEVMVRSEILLQLLDPVMVVTLNGVKKRAKRAPKEINPEDERCARWLYGCLLRTAPKAKQPNFVTWTSDVRLMRERDDRTHKEICALFLWAHKHSFWRGNILSPKTLREHWDQLCIQRDTAAEPKKANVAWWLSDEAKLAKANEVGVGPAHQGESSANWEARIHAAIDNGGKPPAPISMIRPQAQPTPLAELVQAAEPVRRAGKPEGLVQMMKEIGQVAPRGRAA